PLGEDDLMKILTEPRNALVRQYQKFFEMEGATLEFTEPALREIARKAKKKETGARGLRSVVEEVMFHIMYELPDRPRGGHYVITPEVVRGENSLFAQDAAA
ncbi:MAG: ATP-dependent Clp protease ATP-binding subunit ClpX, partial [Planctomycetaceae bacterium]